MKRCFNNQWSLSVSGSELSKLDLLESYLKTSSSHMSTCQKTVRGNIWFDTVSKYNNSVIPILKFLSCSKIFSISLFQVLTFNKTNVQRKIPNKNNWHTVYSKQNYGDINSYETWRIYKKTDYFSVKSCFEHIIWDMINEGGVPDKTGNEFFENFKKALTYLEIDCTAIENLNKSNVLQYDEKIFNL